MANADSDDSSEHVKITLPRFVKQPLHMALVNEDGSLVVRQHGGGQLVFSGLSHLLERWTLLRENKSDILLLNVIKRGYKTMLARCIMFG